MMFRRILLATNGSDSVKKAEDYALYLTKITGAELTVVHVLDDTLCHYGYVDQLLPSEAKESFVSYVISEGEAVSQEIMQEFSRKAASQEVNYSFKIKRGVPAQEIAALAYKDKSDLIIMGGRYPSRREGFRLVTFADKVIAQSVCSVMTLY